MADRPSVVVTPAEGSTPDAAHWCGVAAGGCFQLHLSYDAAVFACDTVVVAMARSSCGKEVVCRETTYHTFTTSNDGSRSLYHVEKWARRNFQPLPRTRTSAKVVKQSALGFQPLRKSREAFLQPPLAAAVPAATAAVVDVTEEEPYVPPPAYLATTPMRQPTLAPTALRLSERTRNELAPHPH